MTKRDPKINKTKLKQPEQGHLQNVSQDVPTRHYYGEIFPLFLKISMWGCPLQCPYTTSCSMKNKHGDLDITEVLWGYHFMGLTDKVGWIMEPELWNGMRKSELPFMRQNSWTIWSFS